jgi:hypothetical protein
MRKWTASCGGGSIRIARRCWTRSVGVRLGRVRKLDLRMLRANQSRNCWNG